MPSISTLVEPTCPSSAVSRTDPTPAWSPANTRPAPRSSISEQTARTAAGERDVYLDGGALVRCALEAGLVDEITLTMIPIVLGRGRPLFAGVSQRYELELIGSRAIGGGLVELRYRA